jgi:Ca-activated chloride channel homolog
MFCRKRELLVLALAIAGASWSPSPRAHAQDERSQPPAARQQTPTPTPPPPAVVVAPPPRDEEDVERIQTDLTNVLLNVVDKQRRLVTTLAREDVRVLEDGVEQQVTTFQRETDLPLSLVILVDISASQEGVMQDEREAATAFVDAVLKPDRDAAAVATFTGITRIDQPLTRERAALAAAIEGVKVEHSIRDPECGDDDTIPPERKARCLTGVWDAIFLTVEKVLAHTPASTRRAIVILTDGDDTSSVKRIYQAVEQAVQHNVAVYPIGIRDEDFEGGGGLRKEYLRNVAEGTGGRAFFPKNRRELDAAFAQINQELRTQYLLAYTPSNKKRDGSYRRVTVEVTNPKLRKEKLRLHYRQGYYARLGETATPAAVSDDATKKP